MAGYPGSGGQQLPISTPMYNQFAGVVLCDGLLERSGPFRLRNIKTGEPAIANRLHIGEVVRYNSNIHIHQLEGRKPNIYGSSIRISGAHHVGRNCHTPGCMSKLILPDHVRIVCVDAREMRWCSVGIVAFHSFAWPRNTKEAKGLARTLFTDHCGWADVLVVRGHCLSSSHACFRANRVLENLLRNWSKMGRSYMVCKEGSVRIGGGDPVPVWLGEWCVYNDFCQCNLVGFMDDRREVGFEQRRNWHHPGAPCSNLMWRCHQLFKCNCRCSQLRRRYPGDQCNRNTMNVLLAIRPVRSIIHVLVDATPSVPPKRCPAGAFLKV